MVVVSATDAEVEDDDDADVKEIEAVPIIDEYPEVSYALSELGTADLTSGQTQVVALGLRRLQMNQDLDPANDEVRFTAQQSDNYALAFPQAATAYFDNAIWSGSPAGGTSTSINPVLQLRDPVLPGWIKWRLWFYAADVNVPQQAYNFTRGGYERCFYPNPGSNSGFTCALIQEEHGFPLAFLPSSNAPYRAYMHEDDYAPSRFSTRSGPWQGNIATYNFGTSTVQTVNTKLDANNHTFVSSDDVFTSSGFRQITRDRLWARTWTEWGQVPFDIAVNGVTWTFSWETFNVPNS